MRLIRMLNKLSFAKSVVGRTGKFLGAIMFLPLYMPEIIRIGVGVEADNNSILAID